MKKILYILSFVFIAFSCDVNDDFDNFDDLTKPNFVYSYTHTFDPDTDVATIVSALRANKNHEDSLLATSFNTARTFSESFPANVLLPYLFKSKYYSAVNNTRVKITYDYANGRSAEVTSIGSAEVYTLEAKEYASVWGAGNTTAYLTPTNNPANLLPALLAAKYPSATDQTVINVSYQYADQEPDGTTEYTFQEDFDSYAANDTIMTNGWTAYAEEGNRKWQAKVYSGNGYAQMSANGGSKAYTTWMITPEIDLGTTIKGYNLSFDITVGYWNASCLSVLISTDANAATDPTSATWTDVTNKFTIPTAPSSGYGTLATAGSLNLDDYSGKIYVAFKYSGDADNSKTTTYQVDNVEVKYSTDSTVPYWANNLYKFENGKWSLHSNVLMPTGKDYQEMGVSTLTTSNAINYIPTYLDALVKYKVEGTSRIVSYKTSSGFYADEYVYTNGAWTSNSFVETKTEQYVYSTQGWVFDPTIIITLDKSGYQSIVNYVRDNLVTPENPNIVATHANGDSEYYFGFAARYSNITYRAIDRVKDTTYPVDADLKERVEFMNERTIEGLALYLTMTYPDATPTVNGVNQYVKFSNLLIYSDPTEGAATNSFWTYTLQCVGDKEWVFVERELIK